jgi:alkylation response protein AidB-like acyl-CoA dehydrogenase
MDPQEDTMTAIATPPDSRSPDATSADLLAAARRLGSLIRDHAEEAERERRLSSAVTRALAEAGLFRLLLPRGLGGHEVDPVTCARLVEEVAGHDSAAGWALQAGNVGGWWAARLPKEGVEEIYRGHPSAIMAAALHPPQQAREAPGGFRISGRGPLASNVHQSEWLFLTAMIFDGDAPLIVDGLPRLIAVVLRTAEVEIVDTWVSLGMRGTDSNDVVMHDVFVPAARTFPLVPDFVPGPYHQGPLYRFPGIGAASFTIAPVALAVARGAISEVMALAERKTAFGFQRPLRERPAVQATVARAEGLLRAARLLYYDTLAAAWARTEAGEPNTLTHKADLQLAAAHLTAAAAEATDLMHRVAGTTGVYARSPLERHLRDIQTLRHHGFLSENRFEAVGQVYCGVPPEFPMIAF